MYLYGNGEAKGRLALKGSRAPKAVLQRFNLLRDDKPTNAAMLLFGKNPRRFFNNAQVHFAPGEVLCDKSNGIATSRSAGQTGPFGQDRNYRKGHLLHARPKRAHKGLTVNRQDYAFRRKMGIALWPLFRSPIRSCITHFGWGCIRE